MTLFNSIGNIFGSKNTNFIPSTPKTEETNNKQDTQTQQQYTGHFNKLYLSMIEQPHLLVAGATGSGKSVLINGLIYHIMGLKNDAKLILIDPKRVELSAYKNTTFCSEHATEQKDMINALRHAMNIVENRYRQMEQQGIRKKTDAPVYVIIDELADLMTTNKHDVQPLIQRLAQVGRAANVHLIVATQCPLREIIPTAIKCNFDARVGLRTRSAQDSRNILGTTGLETLPRYGECIYMNPEMTCKYNVPMYSDEELNKMVKFFSRH